MRRILAIVLSLAPAAAMAQEQPNNNFNMAVQAKLMAEISAGLNCNAEVMTLRAELAKLKEKPNAEQKPQAGPNDGSRRP